MEKLILTPKKRLEVYNKLLTKESIHGMDLNGMCHALSDLYRQTKLDFCAKELDPIEDYNPIKWLPELNKFNPKNKEGSYWFPLDDKGLKKRIKCIKAAIKDVKTTYNI